MDQKMILQMALQRCNNPKIREIIQTAKNPQVSIQNLCNQFPDIAKQIDTAIGQGQNPQTMVMNLLNNR